MKPLLVFLALALLGGWRALTRIHDRNEAVHEAQTAYRRGHFAAAMRWFGRAADTLGAADDAVLLDLGHAAARAGQPAAARAAYGRLLTSRAARTRSVARQQLAVLAAGKGEYAQALGLLRQALLDNPANGDARHNYEVISDYLQRRQQGPDLPPPGTDGTPGGPDQRPGASQQPARQPRPGQDRPGQLDDPTQPADARNAERPRPNAAGRRDPNRSNGTRGNAAPNFRPGQGAERNVARGTQPGNTRGLSDEGFGEEAAGAASRRAGTDPAALDEAQLQTQRARLQQMNLSSSRARQLLEALSAAEQQYLQQLPRAATTKPDPNKPAW